MKRYSNKLDEDSLITLIGITKTRSSKHLNEVHHSITESKNVIALEKEDDLDKIYDNLRKNNIQSLSEILYKSI